jgi:hypothetical protein
MHFPATPADITPQYLTAILRESGTLRENSVASVHIDAVPAGRGFAGQSAHLTMTYERDLGEAPTVMFAKQSSANPEVREQLRRIGIYEAEAGFYRHLSKDCPLQTPRSYAALYEPSTGESLLLLEDIGHLRFGDNLAGSTIEDARNAVMSLARMQAHYWNSPKLETAKWLRSTEQDRAIIPAMYRSLLPTFEKRFDGMAPGAVIKAAHMLSDRLEQWIDSHRTGPRTLAHGDFRPDNFAFDASGEMVVFDWQTARYDAASRDLAYFLVFALPVEVRRTNEFELLKLYHRTLQEHGVRDYSFNEVEVNHRRSIGSALARTVTSGALLDFSSERGKQLLAALLERVAGAVEDHDFLKWGVRHGKA